MATKGFTEVSMSDKDKMLFVQVLKSFVEFVWLGLRFLDFSGRRWLYSALSTILSYVRFWVIVLCVKEHELNLQSKFRIWGSESLVGESIAPDCIESILYIETDWETAKERVDEASYIVLDYGLMWADLVRNISEVCSWGFFHRIE